MPHDALIRVRYAETDQMGVVYHANYIVWMEVGRVEYCRSIGLRYKDMEQRDQLLLAVVECHCRFLAPARYDDEVVVETDVLEVNPRLIRFGYTMHRVADRQKLATGETKHLFCRAGDLKPCRLPEAYQEAFGVRRRVGELA